MNLLPFVTLGVFLIDFNDFAPLLLIFLILVSKTGVDGPALLN